MWYDQKLGLVGQTTCFFVVSRIFGNFQVISIKQNASVAPKMPTGDNQISHCEVFQTVLCKEIAQKLYRKLPKIVLELENSVFPKFGSFQGNFDQAIF